MTATKYSIIQKNAYIQGRAEEQQKAEQLIYENYIPVSLVEEKIEELKNEDLEIYDTDSEDLIIAKYEQRAILDFLQELLEKR